MTEEPFPVREPPLQTWSRAHALAMLAALVACAWLRAIWPSASLAAPSFLVFIVASRASFTPSGRFGFANAVTCMRLALVLSLTIPPAWLRNQSAAWLTVGILLLDLLDGRLARARGDSSAFGAHFDMETDAFLVLVVSERLWLAGDYGPWALAAGLLRYVYVLSLWVSPGKGREAPRSAFGRYAFLILMLGLVGGLLARGWLGSLCVALGTLSVSFSFARSFYFSHAPR